MWIFSRTVLLTTLLPLSFMTLFGTLSAAALCVPAGYDWRVPIICLASIGALTLLGHQGGQMWAENLRQSFRHTPLWQLAFWEWIGALVAFAFLIGSVLLLPVSCEESRGICRRTASQVEAERDQLFLGLRTTSWIPRWNNAKGRARVNPHSRVPLPGSNPSEQAGPADLGAVMSKLKPAGDQTPLIKQPIIPI
jgi:hypothetical protein